MSTSDHTTAVEYRTIERHPGYRFGSDGSIWLQWLGTWRRKAEKIDNRGYLFVVIKERSYRIHRLILEAFVGPRPAGLEGRHLNGNPRDNRLQNICWGTPAENGADKVRHGTSKSSGGHGEKNGRAVLTKDDVLAIRERYKRGESCLSIARDYDCFRHTVYLAAIGKTWRHIS